MKTVELVLDIKHTRIDEAMLNIKCNLVRFGYGILQDYYVSYEIDIGALVIRIYSQKMFEDKRVKELLLEYLV